MYGPKSVLPSPTRDVIQEALLGLGGGPASVGPLAFSVCDLMKVDIAGVQGAYDLRRLISWGRFRTELKQMTADGVLVSRTRLEWHDLTEGAVFPEVGHGTTPAYALASVAASLDAAATRAVRHTGNAHRDLARQKAQARVLVERRADVERYMREWLRDNPEGGAQ